jgi:CheY-like chemotaxis protein
MIEELLDFAKLDSGTPVLDERPLRLDDLAEEVCGATAPAAHAKDVRITLSVDSELWPWVRGDGKRLRQVLFNLVSNAIKFTKRGAVVVRVLAMGRTDDRAVVRFQVEDSGEGILAEDLPHLFEIFFQGEASRRSGGGAGLGLAVVKQIMTAMGGEVEVRSRVGHGSVFTATVELAIAEAPEAQPDLETMRYLLLFDDDDERDAVAAVIRRLKATAIATRDMERARVELASGPIAAVIACELFYERRREDLLAFLEPSTPLILCAPSGDRADAAALRKGVAAVIATPLKRTRVHELLSSPRSDRRQPASPAPVPAHAPRWLVVEDNETNRMLARHLLDAMGYACDTVDDGRQALSAVKRGGYDGVLMDCYMPEMDGFEAARAIRRLADVARHIPIIALTADASEESHAAALAAGMDAVLTKPIRPEDLALLLRAWSPPRTPSRSGRVPIAATSQVTRQAC